MDRRIALVFTVVIATLTAAWFFRFKLPRQPSPPTRAAPGATMVRGPKSDVTPSNLQIDTASLSQEDVRSEVRRRDVQDSKWEWRIPIRFYGKAIDEKGQAVPGADVQFQWTNLSAKGSEKWRMETDSTGLFSIDNVTGKRLVVRVSKSGYYASDSRNRFSFEYANPFEEIFYRPNPNTPVLFYLRQQKPAIDVTSKSVEMVLAGDGTPLKLDLLSGKISTRGQLEVKAWKPWPPRPMEPSYEWKIMLVIPGGGFLETHEDFAFEAPETGYEEPYVIDMNPTLGSLWKVSAERSLYFAFGEPRKYGRMSLRTDGGSRYVFLDYVINQSGSRNLERGDKTR
jgi:hypothetical protein